MIPKIQFLIFIALCITFVAFGAEQTVETAEPRDFIMDSYPYRYTTIHTDLLKGTEAEIHSFEDAKKEKILHLKEKIKLLLSKLTTEETILLQLKGKVRQLKHDFFWFFDESNRLRVDEVQLKVNDQERIVEDIVDDMFFEWKKLKPLYGIYSQMFFMEALGFIPEIWKLGMNVFATVLELGLISLLLFGSMTGFFLSVFATLGFSFLPTIVAFSTLLVNIYWVFKLPFIMIQYSPMLHEFLGVYFAFVGILLTITYATFRLVFPERHNLRFVEKD